MLRRVLRGALKVLAVAVVLGIAALYLAARLTGPPATLGVRGGRLAPCPSTPNCVTSQPGGARDGYVLPPWPFRGSADETRAGLAAVLARQPRCRVIVTEPRYLRAEFRSRLFGFVDDVELLLDETSGVVHFRSASRVGRGDLGVNRARMDALARAYLAAP